MRGFVVDLAKLKEFGRRYAEAWGSQDPEKVAAFFAEGGSLSVNSAPPAVGRDAIAGIARGFMSSFPDMVVTMDNLVQEPRGIAFHWTLTGTYLGPEGAGERVRISGYEIWQIGSDGLIAESRGHFDAAEYEHQLEHGYEQG
jgi:predicted ester cyclase